MKKHELQVEALLYAISKYPHIGRIKLMKFIFFTDLVWFNLYEETIFEDDYIRMPYGPVPRFAYELTSIDNINEYIVIEKDSILGDKEKYYFKPKRDPNLTVFSKELLEIMNKVLEFLKHSPVVDISEFTHKFRLWRIVENGCRIPKELFKLDDYEWFEILSEETLELAQNLAKQAIHIQGEIPIEEVQQKYISAQNEVLKSKR